MVARKPTPEGLIEMERQLQEHSQKLIELARHLGVHDGRIVILEDNERRRQLAEAREEERDKATLAWRAQVEANFAAQRATLGRVLWILGGAVLTAFVGFVIKGGLAI